MDIAKTQINTTDFKLFINHNHTELKNNVKYTINMGKNSLRRKKAAANLKTGRFDYTDSAVIINSVRVCKAVQNCKN